MNRSRRWWRAAPILVAACLSCAKEQGPSMMEPSPAPSQPAPAPAPPAPVPSVPAIGSDADLFKLVTEIDPFRSYRIFPNADEVTTGTLNGSSAHRPVVRTSLNSVAYAALQDGRLPAGAVFPDGSVVFKELRRRDGTTFTYTVMYKSAGHRLAGDGWLWAEFSPEGTVGYSITNRGSGCTDCHSLEQGMRNDLVRTFERQH